MTRGRPRRLLGLGWFVALTVLFECGTVAAKNDVPTKTDVTADADQNSGEARLPALPAVPSLQSPNAEPQDIEDLESKLARIKSADPEERREAAREILDTRPRLVAATLARFAKFSERADRERLKRTLVAVREKSNRGRRGAQDDADTNQDTLLILVEQASPKDEGWRDLVELFAISRIFVQIGTVEAARGLIDIYARFGEFMRVDVQNRLYDLKDGAIAALIEARRHKAEKIAHWAERQLDRIGKAVPGEAVRTSNYETLADILRAFGRTKDPDAARIIVSYANNERHQVREAARQAVALMGDVALWQLREAYEDVVGKRARRDWNWDRTARELFYEYDRLHRAVVGNLFDAGKQAEREGKLLEMAKAYDSVLARLPQFEQSAEMAAGYFALADQVRDTDADRAESALVRVQRITKDPDLRNRAKSLYDTVVATRRLQRGVFDTQLLQAATDRDSSNTTAKRMLVSLDQRLVESTTTRVRWLTSGAISLLAVFAIAWVLLRKRRDDEGALPASDTRQSPPEPPPDEVPTRSLTPPTNSPSRDMAPSPAPHVGLEREAFSEEWPTQTSESPAPHKGSRDPFEGL